MDDLQEYPRDTVWYVEARPDGTASGDPATQQGSAVAVCLIPAGETTPRKFLLTCQHLLRGPAGKVDGWGDPLMVIDCYHPNDGFIKPWPARPAQITSLPAGSVDKKLREPFLDWVLLEVDHPRFQAAPCVGRWEQRWRQAACRVVGYPGGRAAFAERNVVVNQRSSAMEAQNYSGDGTFDLTGTDTRPGMSGGAVFTEDAGFFGLHRARNDRQIAVRGVAAWHIAAELTRKGWRPVSVESPDAALEAALLKCRFIKDGALFERLALGAHPGGPRIAQDSPLDRARELLRTAAGNRDHFFTRLLDDLRRLDLGRPAPRLYEELDQECCRSIPWQVLDQLKFRLLQPAVLDACDEAQVATMLRTGKELCPGPQYLPDTLSNDKADLLCLCLNRLAVLPMQKDGGHPMLTFLGRHHQDLGLPVPELQTLARSCECQPPQVRTVRVQTASPPVTLQVVVAPAHLPGNNTYDLEVYLEEDDRVDPLKLPEAEWQVVPENDLDARLSRIAEAARTQVRQEGRQLVGVELFLPFDLLIKPLEQSAKITISVVKATVIRAIGEHWPVVIRSYDRLLRHRNELSDCRPAWESKWQQVQAGPIADESVPWACALKLEGHSYDGFFSGPVLGFMALWPIADSTPDELDQFVAAVLINGIPVGIWVRETASEPNAARSYLDKALRPPEVRGWPKYVHDLRTRKPTEFDHRGLTLFYDRPDWNDPQLETVGTMSERP